MSAKPSRIVTLFVVAILAILLAFGRSPQTRATNRSPEAAYDHKVELINHRKDLEGVLKEDGRNGWRVWSVVAMGAYQTELTVILEKPVNTP